MSRRPNKDCYIFTPQLFWLSQPFFAVLLGCSTRGLVPSLCWDMVLIPASFLQLTWTSCCRGYIIIWRPPTSCERHNSHSIQPLDSQGRILISSTGCTCYLHRCISHLTAWPGQRSICNTHTHTHAYTYSFVNSPEDRDSIPGWIIPKTQKWYLIPPCLTLSIIRYGSRVKWNNPGKGLATSHTLRCCSYWKGSLQVTLD